MSRDETPDTTGLREAVEALEAGWSTALDDGCPSCGPVGFTGCDHIEGYHHALSDVRDLLAAHPYAVREKAKAEERERIEAAALEFVREWTAMDGRGDAALMLHGRELSNFRDQLADVISGRAS